jgi:hypothetical protein
MSDRSEIEIQRQTAFGDDGQLEVTESSVETSLENFGADVDHRDRDSRLGRPRASEFGVDDRPEVEQTSEGDQSTLFPIQTKTSRPSLVMMGLAAVSSKNKLPLLISYPPKCYSLNYNSLSSNFEATLRA